jgi:hypothetical protein
MLYQMALIMSIYFSLVLLAKKNQTRLHVTPIHATSPLLKPILDQQALVTSEVRPVPGD